MRYFEENKEKIKKSACLLIDSNDLVLDMEEKPSVPKSNYCCPPFYIYSKKAVKEVSVALKNGCKSDAPGSFIEYLCKINKVYAMNMPGKRKIISASHTNGERKDYIKSYINVHIAVD